MSRPSGTCLPKTQGCENREHFSLIGSPQAKRASVTSSAILLGKLAAKASGEALSEAKGIPKAEVGAATEKYPLTN